MGKHIDNLWPVRERGGRRIKKTDDAHFELTVLQLLSPPLQVMLLPVQVKFSTHHPQTPSTTHSLHLRTDTVHALMTSRLLSSHEGHYYIFYKPYKPHVQPVCHRMK